jgi:hypothetical protein
MQQQQQSWNVDSLQQLVGKFSFMEAAVLWELHWQCIAEWPCICTQLTERIWNSKIFTPWKLKPGALDCWFLWPYIRLNSPKLNSLICDFIWFPGLYPGPRYKGRGVEGNGKGGRQGIGWRREGARTAQLKFHGCAPVEWIKLWKRYKNLRWA